MKNMLIIILLAYMSSYAFAGSVSSRNTLSYTLGGYALHTVTTNPVQAFQPVYSWRTHTRFDGAPGRFGHNAKLIGHTNENGILNIVVPVLPQDSRLCGFFINEKVAVGSPSSPKSNALNFIIQASRPTGSDFGPLPPHSCFLDGNP